MGLVERFVEKVAEPSDAHNDCWVWTGSTYTNKRGKKYGQANHRGAHRVSYELFVGSIPERHEIHHLCENTLCVRPDHLEALSHTTHSQLNRFARQTHCKHGHEFTEANTYYRANGQRRCQTCHRLQEIQRRERGLKP